MQNRILGVALALAFMAGVARAEEIKATVKKADAEKNILVLTIGGEDKTFLVSKDAEIYTQAKGKGNKPGPKNPVSGGLSSLKEGIEVTVSTIKAGEKEIISSVRVDGTVKKKGK